MLGCGQVGRNKVGGRNITLWFQLVDLSVLNQHALHHKLKHPQFPNRQYNTNLGHPKRNYETIELAVGTFL